MVTLAVGAFITAVVGSVVSWFKGTYNSYTNKLRERDRIITDLQITNEELQSELTEQNRKLQEVQRTISEFNKRMDLMAHGGMSLLRDRIIQSCQDFIERGSITLTARANISELYKWYSSLGGNGVGKYYYDKMLELPVDDDVPVVSNISAEYSAGGAVNANLSEISQSHITNYS